MTTGQALVKMLSSGGPMDRPPFIPILGTFAQGLGQVDAEEFTKSAQVHARALLQTADALRVDAVTVGVGCATEVGVEACRRLTPVLQGRGLVACLRRPDPPAARAYCEQGVDMVFVLEHDPQDSGRYRTLRNVCGYYRVPVILAAAGLEDSSELARQLGLDGAIVPWPTGEEVGILGGGLGPDARDASPVNPPRTTAFFWSFPGQVAPGASPEVLAQLGEALTAHAANKASL